MKPLVVIVAAFAIAGPASAQTSESAAGMQACSMETAKAGQALPFGCANALNLRAMIADPADLSDAQPVPPPVGEPAVRAIGRHRDGQAVPLPSASSMEAPGTTGAR